MFDRLSILINFMFFSNEFFSLTPENDIHFFYKSIIDFLFNFKVYFSIFNTEETKSLVNLLKKLLFLFITCKEAHIHDTWFIAQIVEFI